MIDDEKFNKAVEVVLRHEGGFSNNKNDPGGATKFGISLKFLKANDIDIEFEGDNDLDEIKSLTEENARDIYYQYWWKNNHYDLIENLDIATKIFDLAVNMGNLQAHKLVQKAINSFSNGMGINQLELDGLMGDKTLNAINYIEYAGESTKLLSSIRTEAGKFYNSLVRKNRDLRVFYKGWMARLND